MAPHNKMLTYKVFVEEVIGGDKPSIIAHIQVAVDQRESVLVTRLGLLLEPQTEA